LQSVGCKTPIYTTRSLPIEYQAPLVSPHSNIELQTAAASESASPRICAGDLVAITICPNKSTHPVEPLTARVANDGTILLPQIGKLTIGGLETEIARERIATAVIEKGMYEQPNVDLAITLRGTCRVHVTGAVSHPGIVELQNGSNDLAAAIRGAGGLSDSAGTRVEIAHRSEGSEAAGSHNFSQTVASSDSEITLASLTEDGKSASTKSIEKTALDLRAIGLGTVNAEMLDDGDTVTVAAQEKRTFRIEGLTKSPADVELKVGKDTHVLDAIELAGATPSQLADLVFVIRQLPQMEEPIIISISLSRAKHDEDENLRIAEGDTLLVRRTVRNMIGGAFGGVFRATSAH
jgi:polysaccharide export outer membrane protein